MIRAVVAVVASIVLMSVDHRASHLEAARSLLSTVLYPLQLAIHLPIRTGEWLSEQLLMRRTILDENARLREERLRLRTRLGKLDVLEAENRRLRNLLGSAEKVAESVLVAELISVDMDHHPPVVREAREDGQRGVWIEAVVVVDFRHVLGAVAKGGHGEVLIEAELFAHTDAGVRQHVRRQRRAVRKRAVGQRILDVHAWHLGCFKFAAGATGANALFKPAI